MAPARRADLEDWLRSEAEAAWTAVDLAAVHEAAVGETAVDEALAALPWACTVTDFGQRVLADVNLIDQAVHGCREVIWYASREARHLFPPTTALLDALACAALAHVARFEYRCDLGDLDEASFLAQQVWDMADDAGGLDAGPYVRSAVALARADLWRHRVFGNPEFAANAVAYLELPAQTGDPIARALLAECLVARARTLEPTAALADLDAAREIVTGLLNPDEPWDLEVLPWLEAEWGTIWSRVELAAYELTGEVRHLNSAVSLGRTSIEHVLPSTADAEAAHLQALLAWIAFDGFAAEWMPIADDVAEVAIAAGTGRFWYAFESALTHAEWRLPEGWSQPATTSARVAYDIVDQIIDVQSAEEYRQQWIYWLARTTAIAVPALAAAGAPGPAASRLEQSRSRILAQRFSDDVAELAELPSDLRAEVADPLVRNLRVLRDPAAGRFTRSIARDEVLRATLRVRERPGLEFFRWKLEPTALLAIIGDAPTVYLTPGVPHGVAILGGGPLGAWRSVPLPECGPQPGTVTDFLARTLSRTEPIGRRRQAVDPVTRWLGTAVWEPIADALDGIEALWLVPCGYLGLLPLHAARLDGRGVDFALRRWDIRYAVSARSLHRARSLPEPAGEPVFLGVPQPATQHGLPGAADELAVVAAAFPGGRVLDAAVVSPGSALEALRGAGYLHAACHGTADPADPLSSGLELGSDERLTLRDLSGIRTGLELGVLSACETNVPDLDAPDEAMSLAVGLHLTGCRAVIASSWQVPDAATAALMASFYQRWRGSCDGVTEALRQAQLALAGSERWREPYYWAGFSFLGAPPTGRSSSSPPVST